MLRPVAGSWSSKSPAVALKPLYQPQQLGLRPGLAQANHHPDNPSGFSPAQGKIVAQRGKSAERNDSAAVAFEASGDFFIFLFQET